MDATLKRPLSPSAAIDDRPNKMPAIDAVVAEGPSSNAPTMRLLVKRHSENAKVPTRGSALAAGYDLYRYIQIIWGHSFDHLVIVFPR